MDAESSKQHYNLKWNNFKENLLQIFTEQLHRELLTDVIISCEGKLIKAHRIVLAACSVYFQQLFEVHTVSNPLIILNGVKLDDLRHILTFMYLGEIRVSEDKINDILALANEFQVKGLSNIVFNNIIEKKNMMGIQKDNETIENANYDEEKRPINENYNKTQDLDTKNNLNSSENLKINKPPIAFMIFQNEWRKKLSEKYPSENNKELSVRLSTMWKKLSTQHKAKYYNLAKKSENNYTISDLPPAKRRKNQPQSLPNSKPKQEDNQNDANSSDGLEIVEEEAELIDITEDEERSGVLNRNNQVLGGSLSNNT
nr:protein abrupt-like isoform X2 [Onthophagus taurus]